ncbi:MAG: glycoside hydrolase family 3 N-terminal domain-containing protein, partial [Peristeroidobacter soli]
LGREARAQDVQVLLGPGTNMKRSPLCGRNFEYFSEDPTLAGELAAAHVAGVQSQGVGASLKHFAANNQEHERTTNNSNVDERTLHEIYLPGFEASFKAGVASTMAAYNKTNGYWNAENQANLTGILRDELGWNGFVVSDWHANRSTASIVAGLDMEMPAFGPIQLLGREGPKWGPRLKTAIEGKQVPESALDRAVGRILGQMDRFGMLDGTRLPAPDRIDIEGHAVFARQLAAEGAVLLKNANGAWPLKQRDLPNLLLIGPTAAQLAVGSGVSGFKDRFVAPLDALKSAAGASARIAYSVGDPLTGIAIPTTMFTPLGGSGSGLTRLSTDGSPAVVDATVDFVGARAFPLGRGYTWKGTLKVPVAGEYTLQMQSWGGSAILKVDGQQRAFAAYVRFGHGIPRNSSSVVPTTDGLDNAQVALKLE